MYCLQLKGFIITLALVVSLEHTHALGLQLFQSNINSTTDHQFHAYPFEGGIKAYKFNSTLVNLVTGSNLYACEPLNSTLVAFSVVLSLIGGCSLESKIRQCQNANCVGVVINGVFASAGFSAFAAYDGSESAGDLQVPLVQISKKDGEFVQTLFTEQRTDRMRCVLQSERSPWADMFESPLFYTLMYGVLMPITVWGAILSGAKMLIFMRYKNAWKTQIFLALFLELISNLERIVMLAVDPFFSRRAWPSIIYGRILLTISIGPALTTSLIVAIMWLEGIRRATRNSSLSKYWRMVPVCVFLPMYVLIDAMASIAWVDGHGGLETGKWRQVTGLVTGFSQISIALLFLLYGTKVLKV